MCPRRESNSYSLFLRTGFSYHYSFHYHHKCLWSGLYLHHVKGAPCLVSTRSLSGFARYSHVKGFTEFTGFYFERFHSSTLFLNIIFFLTPLFYNNYEFVNDNLDITFVSFVIYYLLGLH